MAEIERRQVYEVKLAFEVVLGEENVAINLLQSRCGCVAGCRPAGSAMLCVHMHACRPRFRRFIHYLKIYLKIRIDLMRREGNAICTSQLCRWNQPKKAPKRDLALRPLKELNCFQADPTNAGSPPAGALRGGAGGG